MSWNPLAHLSPQQTDQLETFERLLLRFNKRHNLISSRSEKRIHEEHTLHALTLSQNAFPAESRVVDWGTGGGLPALPLAIVFPEVQFVAVDAVRKKIFAVRSMARRLELGNVETWHGRAEEWPGRAQYSVSRAAASLAQLWWWHRRIALPLDEEAPEDAWRPGLLCLKGGDLEDEEAALREEAPGVHVNRRDLFALIDRDFFREKYLLHVYAADGDI